MLREGTAAEWQAAAAAQEWLAIVGWCRSRVGRKEIPHVQGKAAVSLCWSIHEDTPHVQGRRSNTSKMVGTEKGHQRADRLKPQSQKTSQSDHMDHILV